MSLTRSSATRPKATSTSGRLRAATDGYRRTPPFVCTSLRECDDRATRCRGRAALRQSRRRAELVGGDAAVYPKALQDEHGVRDGNVLEEIRPLLEVVEQLFDGAREHRTIGGRDREDGVGHRVWEVVTVAQRLAEHARRLVVTKHEVGERRGVRPDR